MIVALFWLCLFGVAYSYFLYPVILMILPRRAVSVQGNVIDHLSITIIIAAHNEEARIRGKLDNTLELDYPSDRLQVLVASDCSTDSTDAIVQSFGSQGVELIRVAERRGKEFAQRTAIERAVGEVIVFSDTATHIPGSVLNEVARVFQDPAVGAVSSVDQFVSKNGEIVGEGAYVRYEMWLRDLESQHAGLVGLSGSLFAARRDVCRTWDTETPSDFNTALSCVRNGLRAISDPAVVGVYANLSASGSEYSRKVRTVMRGMAAIFAQPGMLSPFRYRMFAFQLFSHKLMRWLVPFFLIGLLVASLIMYQEYLPARFFLLGQLGFYAVALVGLFWKSSRELSLVRLIYFFVQVNIAIFHAALKVMCGQRITVWAPSQR